MRIRGWHIDGFGIFHDSHVENLSDGLTVFYGENEAGKSTLLAFLRGVIFGFPDRRSAALPYPPLRGGRLGGAIALAGPAGIYRLERTETGRLARRAVVRPDGSEGTEDDVRTLLGQADEAVFKSVFAFGLDELSDFKRLSGKAIADRIFSAGIAGAGRSARAVLEGLDKEAEKLLKARGAATINERSADMKQLLARMSDARAASARYAGLVECERAAHADIARSKAAIAQQESRERYVSRLLEYWGVESERQRLAAELCSLDAVDHFPADPDRRIASAVENARTAHDGLRTAAEQLRELEADRSRIALDSALREVDLDVGGLMDDVNVQRERLRKRGEVGRTQHDEAERVRQAVVDLGPAWTEAAVASFDVSLPAVDTVRDWEQQLGESARLAADAIRVSDAAAESQQTFQDTLEKLESERRWRDAPDASTLEPIVAEVEALAGDLAVQARQAVAVLRGAESDCAGLVKLQQDVARRREQIPVDVAFDTIPADLPAVRAQADSQRERVRRLDESRRDLETLTAGSTKALMEFGPGWDEARVRAIDCSLRQSQRVVEIRDSLQEARDKVKDAAHELESICQGRSGQEKDLERLRAELRECQPADASQLRDEAMALRRLRARQNEFTVAAAELRSADALARERAAGVPPGSEGRELAPAWLLPLAVTVGAAFGAAGFWRWSVGDAGMGATLAMLAVAAIAVGVLAGRRFGGAADASARAVAARLSEDAQQAAEASRQRAEAIRQMIQDEAARLSLSHAPTVDDIEERQELWQAAHDGRRLYETRLADEKKTDDLVRSWAASESRRRDLLNLAVARDDAQRRDWDAWKQQHGLPAELTPVAALEFIQQLRAAREVLVRRDAGAEACARIERDVEAWEERARAVLVSFGSPVPQHGSNALIDAVVALGAAWGSESSRRLERSRLAEEAEGLAGRVAEGVAACRTCLALAVRSIDERIEGMAATWQAGEPSRRAARQRLAHLIEWRDGVAEQWAAWKRERGVDPVLSPQGVIDFFQRIEAARAAIGSRERVAAEAYANDTAIRSWESRARGVLGRAGLPLPSDVSVERVTDAVRELAARCGEDRAARADAAGLDRDIERAGRAIRRAEEARRGADAALAALLAEAGVEDEAGFRARLGVFKARCELKHRLTTLDSQLVSALGAGEAARGFRAELATGRVGDWQAEVAALRAELDDLRATHDEAIRRQQDATTERRAIEDAADLADLELQYQAVAAEFQAAADRWRTVKLARGLIDATLREFERTRQPAVLAAASEMFERVTGGRYRQVVQDEGDDRMAVIDDRGSRRRLQELSRGTSEQLYLCVRLGLAREFGRRAAPLPLVMDDVLVNFDATRARAMASELLAFSRENQVLLFTCHAFTRDVFRALDGGVRIDELLPERVSPSP